MLAQTTITSRAEFPRAHGTARSAGRQRRFAFGWASYTLTFALAAAGLIAGLKLSIILVGGAGAVSIIALFLIAQGSKINIFANLNLEKAVASSLIFVLLCLLMAFLRGYFSPHSIVSSNSIGLFAITTFQLALIAAFILFVGAMPPEHQGQTLIFAISTSAGCVCLAQIVLLLVGVRHVDEAFSPQTMSPSLSLSYLGIQALRLLPPIGTGVNNSATVPLLLLILSTCSFKRSNVLLPIFGIFLSLPILFMIDSRSSILAASIGFTLYFIFRRRSLILMAVATGLPTLFLMIVFLGLNIPYLTNIISARSSIYGLFNGRALIWYSFLEVIWRSDPLRILFGSGIFGHFEAGISYKYNFMFQRWGNDTYELASLHNSYLQVIVDMGIVGLCFYLALISFSALTLIRLDRIGNSNRILWRSLLIFLLAFQFVGNSEVQLSPYYLEGFATVFVCFFVVAFFGSVPRAFRV